MKRVTIQEARKLFDIGVVIYLLPSHTEYVPGIKISVFTYNLKDKDFDSFVNGYKAISSSRMRYYVNESEVKSAKIAQEKIKELKGEKSVKKLNTKIEGLKYNKEELMRIGRNVASLWGGECYNFEVNKKEKKVLFLCIEHGDEFGTELTFDELKEYE